MSPPQTGVYQFNLRAYGNLHTNCFMFGIIKMSVQTGNVKHGDIFIDYSFNNFIAHVKTSFKAIAK